LWYGKCGKSNLTHGSSTAVSSSERVLGVNISIGALAGIAGACAVVVALASAACLCCYTRYTSLFSIKARSHGTQSQCTLEPKQHPPQVAVGRVSAYEATRPACGSSSVATRHNSCAAPAMSVSNLITAQCDAPAHHAPPHMVLPAVYRGVSASQALWPPPCDVQLSVPPSGLRPFDTVRTAAVMQGNAAADGWAGRQWAQQNERLEQYGCGALPSTARGRTGIARLENIASDRDQDIQEGAQPIACDVSNPKADVDDKQADLAPVFPEKELAPLTISPQQIARISKPAAPTLGLTAFRGCAGAPRGLAALSQLPPASAQRIPAWMFGSHSSPAAARNAQGAGGSSSVQGVATSPVVPGRSGCKESPQNGETGGQGAISDGANFDARLTSGLVTNGTEVEGRVAVLGSEQLTTSKVATGPEGGCSQAPKCSVTITSPHTTRTGTQSASDVTGSKPTSTTASQALQV
jgi:hypothetical protein